MHSSRAEDLVADFRVVLEDVFRLIRRNKADRCPDFPAEAVLAAQAEDSEAVS